MHRIDVINAILKGELDDGLDAIEETVKERRKVAARAKFHTLRPGDKVRLINLRPKYLIGLTAEVIRHNQTRLVIKLDDPPNGEYGKYSGPVTVSPDMVEAV